MDGTLIALISVSVIALAELALIVVLSARLYRENKRGNDLDRALDILGYDRNDVKRAAENT